MVVAAATAATRLTEDMIIEILVKLPVKSLLRFRCVCKSWLDLIKSPNFIQMHQSNSKNDDECIAVVSYDRAVSKSFVSFHSHETLSSINSLPKLEIPHLNVQGLEVCGPCNGLICLSDDTNIVLCNPSTSEFRLLPLSPCLPCPEGSDFTRESIGFGFGANKNDYKVVKFVCLDHGISREIMVQVEIYNLSANSWVEYKLSEHPGHIERSYCGTLFDGSFYWVAWYHCQYSILSYDMSIDKFNYMLLPDRMHDGDEMFEFDRYRCIRVINDCLAVLIYAQPHEDLVVEVWVMLELGKPRSIIKQFNIGPLTGINLPLPFWKNEALLVKRNERGLASYALDTHEVNYFDINGSILGAIVYKESLVSIK